MPSTTAPTTSRTESPVMRDRTIRPVAAAVVAVAMAVLAVMLFRPPGRESEGVALPPAAVPEGELPSTEPEAPAPAVVVAPEVVADEPGAARTPAPCAGCLDEQAVLDVAATYLLYVMPDYLGIRAEPYAVSIPPDTPYEDGDKRRPLLPPGLVDAPPNFSLGASMPRLTPSEEAETWIVWVQTGWVGYLTLESLIEEGRLPEMALSWPPLKRERHILVNARTGEITSIDGIRKYVERVDPRGTNLSVPGREEARKRAAAWFAAHRNPAGD